MSLDYFLGVALGELGMGSRDFWEMRLKDFFLKWRHAREAEQRRREFEAELTRMQTVALLNVHLERRHRITDARKLWRFPWEQEEPKRRKPDVDMERIKKMKKLL